MSQIIIFRLNVDGSQNDCMAMEMNGNKNPSPHTCTVDACS